MLSTTDLIKESIKSTPLLPDTAELAQYSPRKEEIKRDADSITITSAYSFNSGEVIDADVVENYSGGTLALGYDINLYPAGISITHGFVREMKIEKYNLDEFIGILSNKEADNLKKGIKSFRKQFNDDIGERNKLLFGE